MPKICPVCDTTYPDSLTFCPRDASPLRATVSRDDLIGEVIAERYLVTDLLGQGGMGTVYLARHLRLPQQAAIKILNVGGGSDPEQATRFRQEAEAAVLINHERVARVYDFGTTPAGDAYIAMEYVAGRTLNKVLEERVAFDPVEAAKVILRVAEGLDAAHRLGIFHRDLKPENIMIDYEPNGEPCVKVLDFGIAKMVSTKDDQALTRMGFLVGSPRYMSPEQVRGETIDARSDIYALALLAFLMLTGSRPFGGETPESEMLARLSTSPKRLTEAASTVGWPGELQGLFDRALAREVEPRPSRALDFAYELTDIVGAWKLGGAVDITPRRAAAQAAERAPHRAAERPADSVAASRSRVPMFAGAGVLAAAALLAWAFLSPSDDGGASAGQPTVAVASDTAGPAAATPAGGVPDDGTADTGGSAASAPPLPAPAPAGGQTTPALTRNPTAATSPGPPPAATSSAAPPRTEPIVPKPPVVAAPDAGADDELDQAFAKFDADGKRPDVARDVLARLEGLRPRITRRSSRAELELYVGMSHSVLGNPDQACAALTRADALADSTPRVRSSSTSLRLTLRCQP